MLTAPESIVKRHENRIRCGRGFSINELKEAGVTLEQIRKLKIRIDRRRKSKWPENVDRLKKLPTSSKTIASTENRRSTD